MIFGVFMKNQEMTDLGLWERCLLTGNNGKTVFIYPCLEPVFTRNDYIPCFPVKNTKFRVFQKRQNRHFYP